MIKYLKNKEKADRFRLFLSHIYDKQQKIFFLKNMHDSFNIHSLATNLRNIFQS